MHKRQQTPNTPRDVTEISSPVFVKKAVAKDIKMRHLTQKAAGEMIGFGRQTMSNILSKAEYFPEKQAILFSLAFGYNKEYLMTGKGNLFSEIRKEKIVFYLSKEAVDYCNELLSKGCHVQQLIEDVILSLSRGMSAFGLNNKDNKFLHDISKLNF